MRLILGVIASTVIVAGCADGNSVLTLKVSTPDSLANVDHITITVTDTTRNAKSNPARYPVAGGMIPPAQLLALVLPPKIRGAVHVDASVEAADGTVLGLGGGDYTVAPSKQATGDLVVRSIDALPDAAMSTVTVDRATGVAANGADAAVVTVTLLNSKGLPLPGVTVQLAATGMGVSLTTADPTQPDGTTKSSLTSTVAQTTTVTATALGVTLAQQPTVQFISGRTAHVAFIVQPTASYAQQPMGAVQVALQDEQGQTITTANNIVTMSLSSNSANATLIGVPSVAAVNGVATFDVIGVSGPVQGVTLTATVTGVGSATSAPFNVTAYPWHLVTSPTLYGGSLFQIQAVPANGSTPVTLYTESGGAVFASTDLAASWQMVSFGLKQFGEALVADPSMAGTVYLTGGKFIMKTTNGGMGWSAYSAGTSGQYPAFGIAVDPNNSSILYAGNDANVFKSTDGGKHWTATSFGHSISQDGQQIAVDRTTSSVVYAVAGSSRGLFRSNDAGTTWAAVGNGLPTPPLNIYGISVIPGVVIVQADGSIYRSTDQATTFTKVATGNDSIFAGAPSNLSTLYSSNGTSVMVSSDGGATFSARRNTPSFTISSLAVHPTNPNRLFAATDLGIFISTDGGMTWAASNNGIAQLTIDAIGNFPNSTQRVVIGAADGHTYYTDDGTTWKASTMDPNDTNRYIGSFFHVGSEWLMCTGSGFHTSLDNAATWGAVTAGPCGSASTITGAAMFMGASTGVFKSTDAGMTWPSSNFSTITNSLWAISNSTILAGTPVGIYRSTDSGATWPSVLANDSASSFSSDSTGQQLLAGFKCTTTTGNTGGFRFSTDSGATWGALQNAGTCVASLYALPLTTKQFVATATINGVASVMRSSDIGQTWAALPLPTYGSVGLGPIGVIENQTVFVGTNAGLYQSATY